MDIKENGEAAEAIEEAVRGVAAAVARLGEAIETGLASVSGFIERAAEALEREGMRDGRTDGR